MRDIAADNFRNQTGVNLFRGALLFHSFHSQRLIWGQYSRERSGYNFQHENIWNGSFSRMDVTRLFLTGCPRASPCRAHIRSKSGGGGDLVGLAYEGLEPDRTPAPAA